MKRPFPILGITLILLGIFLLLRELNIFHFGWRIGFASILIAIGGSIFIKGFTHRHGGKAFFGTVVFLFGVYTLLRSFTFFIFYSSSSLPVLLIIFGFAFLTMTLAERRSWISLFPAFILLGTGTLFFLSSYGYYDEDDIWNYLGKIGRAHV